MPLPFYGKYNDYGSVKDCHGAGLPVILEELKKKLYWFGQGPNQYHDCEVKPENFTIEKLFEADHEGRLGIDEAPRHLDDAYDQHELERLRDDTGLTDSQQFELDRLAAKIKKIDGFRQVTHVVIHGDVFKSIMEKWYIEDYVGEGNGTAGHGNMYNHIYFKDVVAFIPAYIERKKTEAARLKEALASGDRMAIYSIRDVAGTLWNDPNLAIRWMAAFRGYSSSSPWEIIDVDEKVLVLVANEDWEGLEIIVKEFLTASWVNFFMADTRKIWVKQCGQGSQNNSPLGYQILADATLDILKAEREEYGDEDADEEDSLSEAADA